VVTPQWSLKNQLVIPIEIKIGTHDTSGSGGTPRPCGDSGASVADSDSCWDVTVDDVQDGMLHDIMNSAGASYVCNL